MTTSKFPLKSCVNKSEDDIQQLLDWSRKSKFSLYLSMFIPTNKEQKLLIPASSPEFPKIRLISR